MFEKIAVAATITAGLAIGLFWPAHHSAPPEGGYRTELAIARSGDHHYYTDADVDGHSVRFMIDTGASETALTEADAKTIGLQVDPEKYEVLGDGASGMVRGQYVELKSIDVGGIKQQDVKAVVVQGASVSLLGQPFLEKVGEIVIRDGEMRLRANERS